MSFARDLRLPYPPLLMRILGISVFLWLLVRLAYVLVLLVSVSFFGFLSFEDGLDAALHPVWPSRALLVALAAALVWLQGRIAHEHLLQANFGVRSVWFFAASLVAAGAADLAVQSLVRVF